MAIISIGLSSAYVTVRWVATGLIALLGFTHKAVTWAAASSINALVTLEASHSSFMHCVQMCKLYLA